jgi:hypothetical protein
MRLEYFRGVRALLPLPMRGSFVAALLEDDGEGQANADSLRE